MKSLLLALLSIGLIFAHSMLGIVLPDTLVPEVVLEGILIGAWVFLWEAIHMLSFQSSDIWRSAKTYKRFVAAKIVFTYKNIG